MNDMLSLIKITQNMNNIPDYNSVKYEFNKIQDIYWKNISKYFR